LPQKAESLLYTSSMQA